MLCLSPLLGAVGDTVEVENTASAFEGFWVWLLKGKHAWKGMDPSRVESLPLCDLNVQTSLRAKQMAFQGLQRDGSLLTSEHFKKPGFVTTPNTRP